MQLSSYLDRIGYRGPLAPDSLTLRTLHRSHLLVISYEHLGIHLGRAIPHDERVIHEQIVRGGRGGWCFAMNGLFA
jgi:N-hydroxyarylamine O-acetyltransferase